MFKVKASGHACGVTGPLITMVYVKLYIPAIICAFFAIPVFIASIYTKRRTPLQVLGGAIIAFVALIVVHFLSIAF